MGRERAQASVETAVLVPVLLLLALACWQALLVGWTAVSAEHAARAGARAELVGDDPRPAAAAALPATMRNHLRVDRDGRRLRVRVAVPAIVPWFALTLSAEADAVRQ
jgi:TadE-like protein